MDTWQGHWLGVVGVQRHSVTLVWPLTLSGPYIKTCKV